MHILACLPTRDIVFVVPLQALSSLFLSDMVGYVSYYLLPAKANGIFRCTATALGYVFFCAARHTIVYLSAIVRYF